MIYFILYGIGYIYIIHNSEMESIHPINFTNETDISIYLGLPNRAMVIYSVYRYTL